MSDFAYSSTTPPLMTGTPNHPVIAKTADYTLLPSDCDGLKTFTNEGAIGAVKFTLPAASAGLSVKIKKIANQDITVDAGSASISTTTITASSIKSSTANETTLLVAVSSSQWYSTTDSGTWVQPYSFQGSTYGFYSGGGTEAGSYFTTIDRFSFASGSGATSYSSITTNRFMTVGASSSTNGFTVGGYPPTLSSIEKFLFSSTNTAISFGNLSAVKRSAASSCSSTQGFIAGGYITSVIAAIDKFDFASNTTAVGHGNLATARHQPNGQSSDTQGFTTGGYNGASYYTLIEKFNFASNSTAASHGNATVVRMASAGQSSTTAGYTSGGLDTQGSGMLSSIDKFLFSSNTTATSHGNLSQGRGDGPVGSSSVDSGYTLGGGTIQGSGWPATALMDKFAFASNSTATGWGNLIAAKTLGAGHQV